MADIVWTEEALSDLEASGDYFGRTSPQYASSIINRLYSSVEPLAEHPKTGRRVPEVGHEAPRELIVDESRVLYQLRDGDVEKLFGGLPRTVMNPTERRRSASCE